MQYQPKREQPLNSTPRVHLSVQSLESPGPEEEVKNLGSQGPVLTQATKQTLIIDHPILQGAEDAGLELWSSTRNRGFWPEGRGHYSVAPLLSAK